MKNQRNRIFEAWPRMERSVKIGLRVKRAEGAWILIRKLLKKYWGFGKLTDLVQILSWLCDCGQNSEPYFSHLRNGDKKDVNITNLLQGLKVLYTEFSVSSRCSTS